MTDADLLEWILSRGDLSDRERSSILDRWRRGAALSDVLEESGHATPSAPRLRESSSSRLPADARTAMGVADNWFGPLLPAGLPKFLLTRLLGEGGMGRVYRAFQIDLSRWVALKLLKDRDPGDRPRFLREARAAGGLSHPNIAAVYEVGEWEGQPYIAMEYVEGADLRRTKVDPRRACELVRDAARALAYAHERGVIHRDVKPQNLLVSDEGRLAVGDFGLARVVRPDSSASLTMEGEIVGTPAYMSPEQARGEPGAVDARTDVYGLGATLYHLVTGRAPFEAPNVWDVVRAVQEQEPTPPRGLLRDLDPDIDTIVLKCLEKDPARRYESAAALADDLARFLDGEPIAARAPSLRYRLVKRVRRRPALYGAAVTILVLVAAAAVFLQLWRRAAIARDEEDRERRCTELFSTLGAHETAVLSAGGPLDLDPLTGAGPVEVTFPDMEAWAEEALRTAAREKSVQQARYYRGLLQLGRGDDRGALEWFGPDEGSTGPRFWLLRGYARERLGDDAGAVADYDRVADAGARLDRIQALVRAADLLAAAGSGDGALRRYAQALELESNEVRRSRITDRIAALDRF